MVGLGVLWLPILLSAVIVFAASSIIHMFTPWHKKDYRKIPREGELIEAFRSLAIPPGDYMGPMPADMKEYKSPEFIDKMKKGPGLILTVSAGRAPGMGKQLVQWFVYLVVVSVLAAYVAGRALPAGAPYLAVFRFAGAAAFIAHSVAVWPFSIWYGRSWTTALKETIDGLLYALLTAGVFGWLWPG